MAPTPNVMIAKHIWTRKRDQNGARGCIDSSSYLTDEWCLTKSTICSFLKVAKSLSKVLPCYYGDNRERKMDTHLDQLIDYFQFQDLDQEQLQVSFQFQLGDTFWCFKNVFWRPKFNSKENWAVQIEAHKFSPIKVP